MNNSEQPLASDLQIDLRSLPALIDLEGINRLLCPMSRSLAYELAAQGEIETASLGIKRGRRVFVTASIVAWLQLRIENTKRPNIAPRPSKAR